MTDKVYTHVSLTNERDTPKLRFTNHAMTRTKRLKGHKAKFVKLPREMNKLEAANYLKKYPQDLDPKQLEVAVQRVTDRYAPKPEKVAKPKAEKKETAKKGGAPKKETAKKDAKPKAERVKKETVKKESKPRATKPKAEKVSKDEIVVEVDTGAAPVENNEAATV